MTEQEIKTEIQKAFRLRNDGTWNDDDFIARMLQLIREEAHTGLFESYLAHVLDMRRLQGQYWSGDKKKLAEAKNAEGKIDKLSIHIMRKLGIVNPELFIKKFKQSILFQ